MGKVVPALPGTRPSFFTGIGTGTNFFIGIGTGTIFFIGIGTGTNFFTGIGTGTNFFIGIGTGTNFFTGIGARTIFFSTETGTEKRWSRSCLLQINVDLKNMKMSKQKKIEKGKRSERILQHPTSVAYRKP